MRTTLGPCLCQGCHQPVWFAQRRYDPAISFPEFIAAAIWRDEDGGPHGCQGAYNDGTTVSAVVLAGERRSVTHPPAGRPPLDV